MIEIKDAWARDIERRGDLHLTDREALNGLLQGETEALSVLIERYTPYVAAVVRNIIGESMNLADIEEVTADVFVALWRSADKTDAKQLKSYLAAIARNAAKNKLRELRREISLDDDEIFVELSGSSSLDIEYLSREQAQQVRKVVEAMRHPEREIFLRYYYFYEPVSVIAESMELSVSSVKHRISRGRESLRAALEEGGIFYETKDHRTSGIHIVG